MIAVAFPIFHEISRENRCKTTKSPIKSDFSDKLWRRERDSNPRTHCCITRFPVVPLRPARTSLQLSKNRCPIIIFDFREKIKSHFRCGPGHHGWGTRMAAASRPRQAARATGENASSCSQSCIGGLTTLQFMLQSDTLHRWHEGERATPAGGAFFD